MGCLEILRCLLATMYRYQVGIAVYISGDQEKKHGDGSVEG